jgi:hypothetical protein
MLTPHLCFEISSNRVAFCLRLCCAAPGLLCCCGWHGVYMVGVEEVEDVLRAFDCFGCAVCEEARSKAL